MTIPLNQSIHKNGHVLQTSMLKLSFYFCYFLVDFHMQSLTDEEYQDIKESIESALSEEAIFNEYANNWAEHCIFAYEYNYPEDLLQRMFARSDPLTLYSEAKKQKMIPLMMELLSLYDNGNFELNDDDYLNIMEYLQTNYNEEIATKFAERVDLKKIYKYKNKTDTMLVITIRLKMTQVAIKLLDRYDSSMSDDFIAIVEKYYAGYYTLLALTIKNKLSEVAIRMIDKMAEIGVNVAQYNNEDRKSTSYLEMATSHNLLDVVKRLIEKGVVIEPITSNQRHNIEYSLYHMRHINANQLDRSAYISYKYQKLIGCYKVDDSIYSARSIEMLEYLFEIHYDKYLDLLCFPFLLTYAVNKEMYDYILGKMPANYILTNLEREYIDYIWCMGEHKTDCKYGTFLPPIGNEIGNEIKQDTC